MVLWVSVGPERSSNDATHTYIWYMYIIMLGDSGPADIWWPAHVAHTLQQPIVVFIFLCYYYNIMILCDPKRRYWPFEFYKILLIYRKKKYPNSYMTVVLGCWSLLCCVCSVLVCFKNWKMCFSLLYNLTFYIILHDRCR